MAPSGLYARLCHAFLVDFTFALLVENIFAFSWQFLRFHNTASRRRRRQSKNWARGVTGFSVRTYTLMTTFGVFSVYFVISKLLILAYFWATNVRNLLIKICWHFKCVKTREFPVCLVQDVIYTSRAMLATAKPSC